MSSQTGGARTSGGAPTTAQKPVPMKLFADSVDRTTPSCIPRLCNLSLTRVSLYKPLEGDVSCFNISVKMQSSKRTPTRSNDIPYAPPSGTFTDDSGKVFDTELDLQFSLQYPHLVKRGGNQLVVMIQRKKKYKNRTMLGYKTLAQNSINMSLVLQGPVDKELPLFDPNENPSVEKRTPIAVITMGSLSTQPVEESGKNMSISERFSDDESEDSSEVSDAEENRGRRRSLRKANRRGSLKNSLLSPNAEEQPPGGAANQRNIKQKFIALLKKFRVADDAEVSDGEQSACDVAAEERRRLEDLLFDELSNLSDLSAGPEENDDLSITSTPKPSLRPFFSSLTLVPPAHEGVSKSPTNFTVPTKASASESDESAADSTPDDKRLFSDEPGLPTSCYLVHNSERHCAVVASALKNSVKSMTCVSTGPDLKAALSALVHRVQNFCNTNSRNPTSIKVVLMGSDSFVNHFLRVYVEQFSLKTPEWLHYFRFFLVPLNPQEGNIARFLSSADSTYPFADQAWFDTLTAGNELDIQTRIGKYVNNPLTSVVQLPIAEVMLTLYKQDSAQAFVPFVTEVRIEGAEDNSPPAVTECKVTPPNSPALHKEATPFEPMELQIDFWTVTNKESSKCTLKGTFRHLQVRRLPPSALLTLSYSNKEKKQKVMRLGKKKTPSGSEETAKCTEGVQRLICSSKSAPLRVTIDGTEWTNVKFFQLSSQWQTHVKALPFAVNSMSAGPSGQDE